MGDTMWNILDYFIASHTMIKRAILLLHFFVICYMGLYAFVCKKSHWDYFYLLFIYCIIFQWTFYNGECMLAYHYKRADDPAYVAGTNFNTDYMLAFGDQFWFGPYTHLRNLAFVASVFLVSRRSRVPFFLYGSFFVLFGLSVASSIYYTTGCDPTFVHYQKVIQLLFMVLGVAAAMYAVTYTEKVQKEVNPFKEVQRIIQSIVNPTEQKYKYSTEPDRSLTEPDTVSV